MNDTILQESFDKAINAPSLLDALMEKLKAMQQFTLFALHQSEKNECVSCYMIHLEMKKANDEAALAIDILKLLQADGTFNNE